MPPPPTFEEPSDPAAQPARIFYYPPYPYPAQVRSIIESLAVPFYVSCLLAHDAWHAATGTVPDAAYAISDALSNAPEW